MQHTASVLTNGKVLVTGGLDDMRRYVKISELYDPLTETWTITGNMSFPRAQHTASILRNGKILVTGGMTESLIRYSTELYDPATGIWMVANNMNHVRVLHTATELENGNVLVAGGDGGDNSAVNSAELYISPKTISATINKKNNPPNSHKAPMTKRTLNKDGH
ncbi:unnamed protein product, partial [Adineta steineri]